MKLKEKLHQTQLTLQGIVPGTKSRSKKYIHVLILKVFNLIGEIGHKEQKMIKR